MENGFIGAASRTNISGTSSPSARDYRNQQLNLRPEVCDAISDPGCLVRVWNSAELPKHIVEFVHIFRGPILGGHA